ncbi:phosphonate metabolism transcriptional regulator PhnF [Paenochrobactrum glaciei]
MMRGQIDINAGYVADEIAQLIKAGVLRTGTKLPTQAELADQYKVNRHVIRKALDILGGRGLVASRQGSGVYVSGKLVDYFVRHRTRYNDNVKALAQTSRIEILDIHSRKVSAELAQKLTIPSHARVYDLHILRFSGVDPLCLANHYFSAEKYPSLPEIFAQSTGISDLITRLGVTDFSRSDTAISARMPTRKEASLLRIAFDTPIVELEGRNVDAKGQPIEISKSVWPASRIRVCV